MDFVWGTTAEPLMGTLAVVPFRVRPKLPLDGADRAVEEKPPGEFRLHGPPKTLDGRHRVRPSHGAEPSADAPTPQISRESPRRELGSLVGDDPSDLHVRVDRLAEKLNGERSVGFRRTHPDGQDLAREHVDDGADDDGAEG